MKTFRDLLQGLSNLTQEQLDLDIAVETDDEDEIHSVTSPFNSLDIRVEGENGILDKGHPVLVWNQDIMPVLMLNQKESDQLAVDFDDVGRL